MPVRSVRRREGGGSTADFDLGKAKETKTLPLDISIIYSVTDVVDKGRRERRMG